MPSRWLSLLTATAGLLPLQQADRMAQDEAPRAEVQFNSEGEIVSISLALSLPEETVSGGGILGLTNGGTPALTGWPILFPGPDFPSNAFPGEPAEGDLDGDGETELVVYHRRNLGEPPFDVTVVGEIRVYRSNGQLFPGWPQVFAGEINNLPVLGDVDGDGDLEIFAGYFAFHHDGTKLAAPGLPANQTTRGFWPIRPVADCRSKMRITGVADLDRDGTNEIIGIESNGLVNGDCDGSKIFVVDHEGRPRFNSPIRLPLLGNGNAIHLKTPSIGNLDGDRDLEIVVAGYTGHFDTGNDYYIYAFHHDGRRLPGWAKYLLHMPTLSHSWVHTATLADLEGDGKDEVLLACNRNENGTIAFAWRGDGSNLPGWPLRSTERNFYPVSISAGNLNGDPDLEIVVGMRLWGGPYGPRVKIYAATKEGAVLPGWPVEDLDHTILFYSDVGVIDFSVPAIADVRGDDRPEIVQVLYNVNPERPNAADILIWNADGSRVEDYPMSVPSVWFPTSVVRLDFDRDGDAEIGVAAALFSLDVAIHFWDLPEPSAKESPWPMWGQSSRRNFRRTNPVPLEVTPLGPVPGGGKALR